MGAISDLPVVPDGACPSNGKGDVAGIGVFFGDDDPRNVSRRFVPYSDMRATNQTAELSAAVEALKICLKQPDVKHILLHTDSMYTINCATRWIKRWKENGWKTANGKPVKNTALIKELWKLAFDNDKDVDVQFIHVRGHSGIYENEQADKLATAACK